ncbi:PhoH family protein [Alkalimonas collagenimarina]|uniref:PhoH-like protein n=1 Tax=Alkalimonas collagenimarina TaxID=400390 RepID=A0ABT9H182_9GAMM|nr:PhoH family protein [Alkalimonas collagenimarina]MDP4537079.1 PhoH family protein [Alkalimonas collagenimarina]
MERKRLLSLCGPFDEHLRLLEKRLQLDVAHRDEQFKLKGSISAVKAGHFVLEQLYRATDEQGKVQELTTEQVHLMIQQAQNVTNENASANNFSLKTKKGLLTPRNPHQQQYVQNVLKHDVIFGIGPAGTGKTYLAVACAVDALEKNLVRRIVLTRPAVEAGEKLGFLPGDLSQKVDPYLRPLYDALFEMLGYDKVEKYLERGIIEIAPLAYMRGRTLNDAFIILDESQNTTVEQMKMFLTRIGFNSKAVITGDITQVDLPRGQYSGLKHAIDVLSDVDAISLNYFDAKDVVRHPIVQKIVMAYEAYEAAQNSDSQKADKTTSVAKPARTRRSKSESGSTS